MTDTDCVTGARFSGREGENRTDSATRRYPDRAAEDTPRQRLPAHAGREGAKARGSISHSAPNAVGTHRPSSRPLTWQTQREATRGELDRIGDFAKMVESVEANPALAGDVTLPLPLGDYEPGRCGQGRLLLGGRW